MNFIKCESKVELNGRKQVIITLTAYFEDNSKNVSMKFQHKVADFNYKNMNDVFQKLDEIQKTHPFYKLQFCESPIEVEFYSLCLDSLSELIPQVNVGHFRVDFAVPNKKIAIELDGHDFHKTKEQRTYDAQRDRYLVKEGWKIIRFTGTEIHSDVMKCIREAEEIINNTPIISSHS